LARKLAEFGSRLLSARQFRYPAGMPQPPQVPRLQFALTGARPLVGWHAHLQPDRPRGAEWDMHYDLELILVLEGQVRIHDRAGHLDLKAGQVWFGGVWEPHGWTRTHRAEVVLFILWPPALALARFEEAPHINWLAAFTAPPRQRPQTPPAQRPAMIALGRRMAELLDRGEPMPLLRLRLLILEALAELYETWTPPPSAPAPGADDIERLNRAVELVFRAPRLVSVAEAAQVSGLSRQKFTAQFQQVFGISFPKYALRYRLSGAVGDLVRTDQPLKVIARQWGFTDESHFDHRFREVYGVTPAQYRRQTGRGAS
jgi:AraC-like DNA-binding protein